MVDVVFLVEIIRFVEDSAAPLMTDVSFVVELVLGDDSLTTLPFVETRGVLDTFLVEVFIVVLFVELAFLMEGLTVLETLRGRNDLFRVVKPLV